MSNTANGIHYDERYLGMNVDSSLRDERLLVAVMLSRPLKTELKSTGRYATNLGNGIPLPTAAQTRLLAQVFQVDVGFASFSIRCICCLPQTPRHLRASL